MNCSRVEHSTRTLSIQTNSSLSEAIETLIYRHSRIPENKDFVLVNSDNSSSSNYSAIDREHL